MSLINHTSTDVLNGRKIKSPYGISEEPDLLISNKTKILELKTCGNLAD